MSTPSTPIHNLDLWLKNSLMLEPKERLEKILHWEKAPAARANHPREEHLLPLMVALGAAYDSSCHISWTGTVNGTSNTAFHFG